MIKCVWMVYLISFFYQTHTTEVFPVLIGTNIISVLMNMVKESHGPRYLQEEHMFAPWHLAFRCASLKRVDPKV